MFFLETIRFRPFLLVGVVLCGMILVFSHLSNNSVSRNRKTAPCPLSIIGGGGGAKGQNSRNISHELFSTPYDEAKVPFTDLSESEAKVRREFWRSHKPSYKCPRSLLSRVGREEGDGGKWVCGLETFGKLTADSGYPCVFYSFGVSGDSSFESEVMQITTCSVYAYDMSVSGIGRPLRSTNPRVHFHSIGISGENSATKKTLKTLMDQNGHSFIDILKIDVEGEEYSSFQRIFQDFPDQLPIGQLMVELHNNVKDWGPLMVRRILNLVEQLEKRGFRVFSIEPNIRAIDHCSEFSFINLKYRRLFIPDGVLEDNKTFNYLLNLIGLD